MINLIPPTARKGVVTEYWVRVCTVWMFSIGVILIIVAILQSPAYVLISQKLKGTFEGIAAAELRGDKYVSGLKELEDAHLLSGLLLQTVETTSFVTIIKTLEELSGENVEVKGINVSRNSEELIDVLEVTGIAKTRSALNDYRNRIEAHELFSNVHLPLSNLAKEEDILFKVEIKMFEEFIK